MEMFRSGGRWRWWLLGFALLLACDLARAPGRQWSAAALLFGIDCYQASLSPHLSSFGGACRFEPSCSEYSEGAIRRDGALVGGLRTAWRILRCGPWTAAGTRDPP